MFGYQRDELIGQAIETLKPERYRGHHVRHRQDYNLVPLVERLRSCHADIAVLYRSGFGEDGFQPDEASALSGRFIQKPFRKDTLLQKIEHIPARQSRLRSAV